MSEPLAALRPQVILREEPGPSGPRYVLEEPSVGVRSLLDRSAFKAAQLLDGTRDAEAVLAGLAEWGTTRAQLDAFVRFLDAHGLLANERAQARLGLGSLATGRDGVVAPGDAPLRFLEGARYGCQASGFCCQSSYSYGPVEEDARARILAEDWSNVPELATRFEGDKTKLFTQVGDEHYLTAIEGRCVFLSPEKRCRVHERLGFAAKPAPCRNFPFTFVRAPDGIAVSLRFECRTLDTGRVIGRPLVEQEADVRALVDAMPAIPELKPIVALAADVPVAFSAYARLEQMMLSLLDRSSASPEELLRDLRDLVLGVVDALPRHPTDAEVGAVLDAPPKPASKPDAKAGAEALLDSLDPLVGAIFEWYPRLAKIVAPADFNKVLHDEWLLLLLSYVRRTADLAGIDHPSRPVPGVERLAAVRHDTTDERVRGLYVDWFKNEIFGRFLAPSRGVVGIVALIALRYVLVRWSARIHANARGADRVSSADVMDGLIVVNRLFQVHYLAPPLANGAGDHVRFLRNLSFERDFLP